MCHQMIGHINGLVTDAKKIAMYSAAASKIPRVNLAADDLLLKARANAI
jgi:hypothetical protein